MFFWSFLSAFLINSAPAAEIQKECYSLATSMPSEVCVYKSKNSLNPNVLYYLHGIFGDKTSWERDGLPVRQLWDVSKKDYPTVVTISFGQIWLLGEKNRSDLSGKLDVVLKETMPAIESRLGGARGRGNRFLLGVSMGGFNAIQLMTARPDLFNRVALGCPAISSVTPFSSKEEIQDYTTRTHADPKRVELALRVGLAHFPDLESGNHSWPFMGTEKINPKVAPKIYLEAVETDGYGFQEGDLFYGNQLLNRGLDLQLVYHPGRHCEMKAEDVVKFLDIL